MQMSVRTEIHVVQTDDALVCRASRRYGTSTERLKLWTDERLDGMARRPDGWQGTEISILQTVQNLWNTSE
jgi:Arc/MetJ family transcription regulator